MLQPFILNFPSSLRVWLPLSACSPQAALDMDSMSGSSASVHPSSSFRASTLALFGARGIMLSACLSLFPLRFLSTQNIENIQRKFLFHLTKLSIETDGQMHEAQFVTDQRGGKLWPHNFLITTFSAEGFVQLKNWLQHCKLAAFSKNCWWIITINNQLSLYNK